MLNSDFYIRPIRRPPQANYMGLAYPEVVVVNDVNGKAHWFSPSSLFIKVWNSRNTRHLYQLTNTHLLIPTSAIPFGTADTEIHDKS